MLFLFLETFFIHCTFCIYEPWKNFNCYFSEVKKFILIKLLRMLIFLFPGKNLSINAFKNAKVLKSHFYAFEIPFSWISF